MSESKKTWGEHPGDPIFPEYVTGDGGFLGVDRSKNLRGGEGDAMSLSMKVHNVSVDGKKIIVDLVKDEDPDVMFDNNPLLEVTSFITDARLSGVSWEDYGVTKTDVYICLFPSLMREDVR